MVLLLFALILKIGIMLIWFKNRPMMYCVYVQGPALLRGLLRPVPIPLVPPPPTRELLGLVSCVSFQVSL